MVRLMSVTGEGIPGDVPRSAPADTVLRRLPAVYAAAADPGRAAQNRAHMRDVAPFLGLTSPVRRGPSRTVLAGVPRPDEADCTAVALRCRRLPEREHHYSAVDFLRRNVTYCSSGFLPVVRYRSGHGDFFVRKAVGRSRREYAKTDPDAVRAFVAGHRTRLAPLSVREALRNVGP